jgi:predicted lipoprotein with Yx(FWY)xxD motif
VRRSATIPLAAAALVAVALQVNSAAGAPAAAPVVVVKDATFGRILARRDHQALYHWQVEKKAGGKIRCTGKCAKLWPPLIVKSASVVPKHVAAVAGTFGTVRRPDGRLQVTYRKLALYTYVHEGPNQVLCNNVDGWFVVKA